MYGQKLFNQTTSNKNIRYVHPTLQKAIDYAQKVKRKFPLVEGIQKNKFDTGMSINASISDDPM